MSGPQPKLGITGLLYGDDYITIQFDKPDGTPDTFTFGLVADRHRFTLAYYGVNYGENGLGAEGMVFGFLDEYGERRRLDFSAPAEDIWRMKFELDAFTKAFEDARRPKFRAAATSYALQQAA